MKIGIDARFAVHNLRGIGNYTLRLIHNLAEIDRYNEYILYIDKNDTKNALPQQSNFKIKKLLLSNYFVWEQFLLPIRAKKDGVDILHCTGNTAPICISRHIKLITTITDVMYLKDYSELPQSSSLYQRLGRAYRKIIVPRAIKNVSKVITISNFSKNDIMKHFPALKEDMITVVYLAADETFGVFDKNDASAKVRDKLGIIGSYILTLGAVDPRKNTELVIKIFKEFKDENKTREKLVIVGIPNWKKTKFYSMVQESLYKKDIIFTDFIAEEDLVLLYNCATVFLYPSLYEGFGLPTLEAMACGVPVITSSSGAISEMVSDAALLVNTHSGDEIKHALVTLLGSDELRQDLVKKGFERVKNFSWRKMAENTIIIYESVFREAYR
jgi:glycosyltransferase involved in cell wall biosynthesis